MDDKVLAIPHTENVVGQINQTCRGKSLSHSAGKSNSHIMTRIFRHISLEFKMGGQIEVTG